MARLLHFLTVVLLCAAMSCPWAEAQNRGRNNGSSTQQRRTETPATPSRGNSTQSARPGNSGQRPNSNATARPGNNQRPDNNATARPGNSGQRPGNNGNRPEGNKPNNNNKPNTPNNNNRPGNQQPSAQHPGNQPGGNHGGNHGGQPGHGPGGHPGHGPGGQPGHGPGGHPGPGPNHVTPPPRPHPHWGNLHYGYPNRPYMPPMAPYNRPTPPPAFRPGPGGPSIATILGIALGTAINMSINSLLYNGYNVTGYSNNCVYISNPYQLNLPWQNATLYYNNGCLVGSEFVTSTPYFDMSQYDMAYMRLVNAYGFPYSTMPINGGGTISTWWGPSGQYVTLQYAPAYANNGTYRYYTTLAFGD